MYGTDVFCQARLLYIVLNGECYTVLCFMLCYAIIFSMLNVMLDFIDDAVEE